MELLFATSNPHKVEEANLVGRAYGISFAQLREPYPEVRDESVAVVAREGAHYVFGRIKKPVLVEDTGLFVEALNGFPGPYSAFAYKKIGCEGILRLLEGKERKAEFVSAIGFHDGEKVRVFEGRVSGTISEGIRGRGGFGFDSIFVPGGEKKTFAEDPETKNRVSHRRHAFEGFCGFLSKA